MELLLHVPLHINRLDARARQALEERPGRTTKQEPHDLINCGVLGEEPPVLPDLTPCGPAGAHVAGLDLHDGPVIVEPQIDEPPPPGRGDADVLAGGPWVEVEPPEVGLDEGLTDDLEQRTSGPILEAHEIAEEGVLHHFDGHASPLKLLPKLTLHMAVSIPA